MTEVTALLRARALAESGPTPRSFAKRSSSRSADGPAHVDAARRLGMRGIRFRSPEHLRGAFRRLGMELGRTQRSHRAVAHRPRRVNRG